MEEGDSKAASRQFSVPLDADELKEMGARPFSESRRVFSKAQLAVRRGIARKMFEALTLKNEQLKLQSLRADLVAFPWWGFYKVKETGAPCRIYNFLRVKNKTSAQESTYAQIGVLLKDEIVVSDVPLTSLQRVAEWTSTDLARMHSVPTPGLFADPIGFINFDK